MPFREVSVVEVREVLRGWLGGAGLRTVAGQAGVDRKTARRYVAAAEAAGVVREGGLGQLTDEVIGQVVAAVRPARAAGHGAGWEALEAEREQISEWVGKDLSVVKIADLLTRRGVLVPYRTVYRFCTQRCGFGRGGTTTVRVADGAPGVECQIDFAKMGLVYDPGSGRRRVTHALIFTAVWSRHMFVWLTFSQTLAAVIEGCEAAWRFFGGVFGVLIPDNASAIVADADAVNPRFTVGWLDYTQHCGFATDAARVRSPQDKPRVERCVQYVRGNFFAGEEFVDLGDAQSRAEKWCRQTAGLRIHGTTCARPAELFAEHEAAALGALPDPYDVPIFTRVKVHRDFHLEVGKALYSAPKAYLGQHLDVRADSALVKLFHRGNWSRCTPANDQVGGSPTPTTCPSTRPATPCATSTGSWPPPANTVPRWGSTPSGCWTTRCLGPRCARSTGCSGWRGATAAPRSTPPAPARSNSTSCPSPRSRRCWRRHPRTPHHRRHAP
jgi:transposase